MDFKALMTKLETIDTKQVLTESIEQPVTETTVVEKPMDAGFTSSIARALVREFGYDSQVQEGPLDDLQAWHQKNTDSLAAQQSADAQDAAAAKNPEAIAAMKAKLTPSQLKWLGGADITDKYIRMRMPKPLPGEVPGGTAASPAAPQATDQKVDPDSQQGQMLAAQTAGMNDPASGVAGVTSGSQQDNMLAAQTAGMDSGGTAASPAGSYDSFGNPVAAGSAAATNADPSGLAQAQQDLNKTQGGTAASPAAPADKKKGLPAVSPAVVGYASSMGLYKNGKPDVEAIKKFQKENGLTADGIIGPNTSGAIISAQKPGNAGSGRGGQGGPTAAQAAQAGGTTPPTSQTKPTGGTAASPAAGAATAAPAAPAAPAAGGKAPRYKTPQEYDREIARFSKTSDPKLPPNARYIATLQAEKAALGGGTAASPAAPAAGAATAAPGTKTTTTNNSVQGTMKMGKPDGPITFNGKTVNPGDADYAAASQALIAAQGKAANYRSQNQQNLEKRLATSGAPVTQGAANADRKDYEESLSRFRQLAGL